MTKLHELAKLGQAVWLDYIRRSFTESGELEKLVEQGVRGVTSNPTIFEKAIAGSQDYDDDLLSMVEAGRSVEEIYEALVIEDIQSAADVLRPVYDRSGGADGFVSLEVSPTLARQTQATLSEVSRLFEKIGRPNAMIKIPATQAGIPAIEAAIRRGVNVNVTLIFSLEHYRAVVEAYISGLEQRAASGADISNVASVASFFVSRVDTAVDRQLESLGETQLQGKIAVDSAKIAYAYFKDIFSGDRWQALAEKGGRVQRPLWASTSTKNPAFPDTLYVDCLIGPDTVNTVPPATLSAFLDHGKIEPTLEAGLRQSRANLERLSGLGVDLDAITQKLQDEGVAAFSRSFEELMAVIAEKREKLLSGWQVLSTHLGEYGPAVERALDGMERDRIMPRIWEHDHTVWKPDPAEISNRLGWLHIPEAMKADIPRLEGLAQSLVPEGFTDALLLGMGGSSLAPEVFRETFGVRNGYLDLAVLDSTDPGAVIAQRQRLDLAKTLFIVATKSGGTVETLSFFKYFYNLLAEQLGADRAGAHFIAITDPGSKLVDIAQRYNFREIFLNDPNIGGRYSALSYFGLVPAALVGVDIGKLLENAMTAVCNCEGCNSPAHGDNLGARLGAAMGALAKTGRDKLTLILSPQISAFGDWVEQLIAESTGKDGSGILPVVGEPLGAPGSYGNDRLFVHLQLEDDNAHEAYLSALQAAGHPLVRLKLRDLYDLGGQFFFWEMATAVAGHLLGINPFNQPNVESSKALARQMVAAYKERGELPDQPPSLTADGIAVYGDLQGDTLEGVVKAFLDQARPGSYVALQAYLNPTPETDSALQALRVRLRDRTRMAVTSGYGPRFLHSTGQLHKGDAGLGLSILLTADPPLDVDIPDEAGSMASSISFGVLESAQALGDRQALQAGSRGVIRFHLGDDVPQGLARLRQSVDAEPSH